ncbi:MAG: 50S ribosomal protein L28 [Alphaproteobacteria bacterium]|nr:50S ribosomal protein L28 [Alphaproteobacteria bacterium]
MARRCAVSGKGVMSGNNVSHANNKTRRRFLPNLQVTSLYSEALGRAVQLRLSTNGVRTVEHRGGLDAYLRGATAAKLSLELKRLKKQVEAKASA